MKRGIFRVGLLSLAAPAIYGNVYAQTAPNSATATQPVRGASSPQYVPIQDYLDLKAELGDLKRRVDAQESRAASATPTTRPAAGNAARGMRQAPLLSLNDDVNDGVHSLFEARTQEEYFSPFDHMNPAHMRADMPMQIGQLDDMSLYMGLQTVGRVQYLQQHDAYTNGVKNGGLDGGFQTPFANLSFLAAIQDKMDVYFDMYISSRPHPSTMYGHEGYLLIKQLPGPFDENKTLSRLFDNIDVKVGAFDIDFGDQNYHRSNNARVWQNPLIGNAIVDPNVEEIGGEVYNTSGPIYWLFGAGSGTTTEHFDRGAEPSVHAKVWGYPLPEVRTSLSAYHVDLSDSNDTSNLFAASRSGGSFAGVFGGGDSPGQILPRSGKDSTAVQGDVTWNHWPFEVYGNLGYVQDTDTNGKAPGAPAERWVYGGIEGVYHLSSALYVAGRYSVAVANAVHGVSTSGWADRAEIGGGYWITRNLLAKVSYVYESFHGFDASDGVVSGVDAGRNPDFNGVLMEVSFGF